jgi:hypothetical protein
VLAKTARLHGGTVPIPMRCLTRKPCHGVLLMHGPADSASAPDRELARVDLDIPARTDVVIEVTLSRSGRAYVRTHHHFRADLTAAYENKKGELEAVDLFTVTVDA